MWENRKYVLLQRFNNVHQKHLRVLKLNNKLSLRSKLQQDITIDPKTVTTVPKSFFFFFFFQIKAKINDTGLLEEISCKNQVYHKSYSQ